MGYDLSSIDGKCTGMSSPIWHMLQWIGKHWGWEPEGTYSLKNDDDFWDNGVVAIGKQFGSYDGNDLKVVSSQDAHAWAEALELALSDKSFGDVVKKMQLRIMNQYKKYETSMVKLTYKKLQKYEYRELIMDFISFCKRGAFVIS
jgi:hypothetical protein